MRAHALANLSRAEYPHLVRCDGTRQGRALRFLGVADERAPPLPVHSLLPSREDVLRRRVKAELRKRMRGLRNALPPTACAERSERIAVRLLLLDSIARARAVALFWPITQRHEVDLRQLHARLHERGMRIAYPVVDQQSGAMTFRFVASPESMIERTLLGASLQEPSPDEPEAAPGELDVIVVPALAVDPSGQRIGYGAGHYDRTLPRFSPPAVTIAVAFDFQLVVEVPSREGDVPTHEIVTDARWLRAADFG
jgi:5-formyltetrahydrofolate cyclo-ligase